MKEERRRRTEEGEEDCQIVGESRGGAFISITSSREDEEEESEKGVVGQENRNFFTAAFDKERNRERGGEQEKEERTDKRKQKKRGRDLSSTSSSTSSHAAKKKKTKEKREDTVPVKCKIEPCKVARKDRGAQSRSSVQNSSCSTSSSSPSSLSHSSSSSQSSSLSSPSSSSSSSPSSSSSSSSSALSPKGYLPTALGYASRLSRHPNKGPVGNPELEESDPSVLHEKLNQVVSLFQNECRSIISTWKSRHLVKKRKEGKSRLTSPQHHDVPSSSPSYDRSLQGGCTYTREPTKEEGDDNEVSVLYAVEPEKRREEEEEEENNEDEREEENTFFSPGGVCVHTGAGVSTSAGILDFRGPSGVWTLEAQGKELHDAEKNTVEVSFGRHRRPVKAFHLALPTPTHLLLKTLSTVPAPVWLSSQRTDACSHLHHPPHHPASPTGRRILSSSPNPSPPPPPSSSSSSPSPPCSHCSLPLSSSSPPPPLVRHIITQNVDGLHMRCGTSFSRLSEVHGSMFTERCDACGRRYLRDFPLPTLSFRPTGRLCGICSFPPSGVCTDVLLDWRDRYERDLEHFALRHSRAASLHLCLGTSLQIQPACHFPGKERSTKSFLIIVNLQATPLDSSSDICLRYTTDGVSTFLARELGKGLLSRDRGGEEEEEKENADEQGERGYTDEEGERDKGDGDVALVKGERIERRREEDLNDGEDQDDVVMNYKEGECPQNVGRRPREEDKERKKKKENERNCENMNDREKERRSLKNEENRTQMKKEEKANVNDGAFKEEEDRGKRRRGREGTSQVLGWIWSKREGGRWGDVGTVTLKNRETPLDKVRQRHAKDSDSHALLDIMRERKMVGKETEEKTEEKDDRNERDARANGDLGMASARERDGEEEKKEKEEKETEGYEEETRRVVMSSEDEKKDKEEEKRKKATARELNGNEIPLFQKTEEEYYRQGDQERKEEKERRGEEETFWRGKEEKEQDNKRGREKRDGIEGRKVEHFPFIRTSLLFILRVPLHSVPALALPILPPSSSPPPSSSSSHNGRSSSSFACGARKVHTPAAASTSAASLHPEIPSHPPEGGEQGEGGEQQQEERRQEGEEEKKKTVMEKKKIEGEEDTARPQDFQTDCEILLEEEKEKKDGKEKGLEKETSASTLVDGHLGSPGEISGDEKVRKRNTIHDSISSSSSFSSPGVSNYRKVIPSGEDSKEDQGSVPVSSSSSLSSSSSSFDLRKSSSFSRFRREQRFLLRISCGIRIIEEISPCSSSSLLGNLAEEEVKEDGDRGSYDSPPHRHLERRKEGCSREVGDSSDTRAKISHVDTLRGVWTVDISQDTHLQVLLWYNTTLRITLFYQPYQRGIELDAWQIQLACTPGTPAASLPLSLDLSKVFPSYKNVSSSVSSSSLGSLEEIHKRRRTFEEEKKDAEKQNKVNEEKKTISQDLPNVKKGKEMDMDGPMIEEAPSSSASSTPSSSSSFSSSSLSSTAMQRHRQDRYYPEPRGLVSCLPSSSLLLMGAKGEDDLSVTSSSSAWSSTEEDEEFSAFKDGGKDRKEVDEEEGKRRRRRIRRTRLVACLGYILGERGDPEKVNGKRKIDCRSAPGGMPSQEEATRKTDGKEKQYLSFSSSPFTSTPPPLPGAFFNPCDPSSSSCCLSRDPTPPGKDEEARETPRFLPSSCCSCPSPNTRVTEGYEIPLPEAFHVLYQLHSHAKISLCSSNGAPLRSSSLSPRNEERKEEDARRTSSSSCHKHSAMCASQTSLRRLTSFERSSQAKPPSPSVSSRSSFPSSSPPPPPLNPKVEGSLPTVRRYPRRSTRIASSFACAQNSSSSFCFRDHRKQERENEGSEGLKKEVNDPSDKASLGKGRKTPFYPCLDSQQIPLLLPPVLGEDFDRSRHEEYNRISQLEERKQSQDDTEDDGGMVGCLSREEEERSSSTRREHTVPGSKEDAKSVGPLRVGQEEEEEEEQRSCREKTDEENEKEGHISKQDGLLSFNTRKAKTWEDRGVMNPAILLDDVSSESRFHSSSSSSFSERESKISPVFFICKDWGLGELLRDPVGLYTLGKLPISPCRKWRVSYSSFSSSSSSVFSSTAVSSLSKRKEEGEEERHTVRATAREKEKVIIEPVKNDIGRCTEEAERVKAKYSAEDGDTRDFGEIENDRKTERTGKKEERRSDTCDGNDENSASYTPMKMQEGGEVKDEESREKEADRIRKMGKASQELNKKKRKTPRKPAYILHKEAEFATKLQYLNEWKEILKSLEEDRCLFHSSSSIEKGDVNTLREERREDQEAEKREEKKACQEKVANKGEDENVLVGLKDSKRRFVGPAVLQALRLLPLWTLLRCIDTLECV